MILRFVLLAGLPLMMALDVPVVLREAQSEEVSFLEDTIKSMERNKEAVLKSNEDLDKLVKEDGAKLAQITGETDRVNQHALATLQVASPMSLLQVKSFDDSDEEEDEGPMIAHGGPQSILQRLQLRASASEQRYKNAMKKLQLDKENLIKDENFRRARAVEERRHLKVE